MANIVAAVMETHQPKNGRRERCIDGFGIKGEAPRGLVDATTPADGFDDIAGSNAYQRKRPHRIGEGVPSI
jgi:hypothetical protein